MEPLRGYDGDSVSTWMHSVDMPQHPALTGDVRVDVCIVGAGIAGLTAAYHLAREHRRVIVLDAGGVATGQTQRTTAHLSSALDDRFYRIEALFGREGARLAAQSHSAAIDRIEEICHGEGIACAFERLDGYLFAPPDESPRMLEHEYHAAQRAGLEVEWVDRAPLDIFDTGRCLRFAHQAQFHPLQYMAGLVYAIERDGGRIYSHAQVQRIEPGSPVVVETADHRRIEAGAVIVATNSPINEMVVTHIKQAPYRTYVIALRVGRGEVHRALYWDTLDPYHYVRLAGSAIPPAGDDFDLLIVGGEDEKTGQHNDAEVRYHRLESWTRERFPMAQRIEYRWSGQVMEPVDLLAFIGQSPGQENVYIATGDSGHGMTHGTIAGMLLPDLIAGRANPWEKIYTPARLAARSLVEFTKENLNVAARYGQWLTGGEVASEEAIAPGSGAIMRQGMRKLAVYRDPVGQLHRCSAVCTHLNCIVHWNSEEHTWDCPCHGSRFDPAGHVVEGPATSDLEQIEEARQREKSV